MLKEYYHCKLIPSENHELKFYEAPILKRGNYQPLSGYNDVAVYGKDIQNRWRMVVDYRSNANEFSEGDLLYLDGAKPNLQEENGEGANAVITAVNRGFLALTIEIESVIPRG
jgi:hypothetical protein